MSAFLDALVPGFHVRVPTAHGIHVGPVVQTIIYNDGVNSNGQQPGDSMITVTTSAGDVMYRARDLCDWGASVAPVLRPIKSIAAYELARREGLQIERADRPGIALAVQVTS